MAAAIADKTALLCFDELHVTDIADAMILGRLFKALFEAQVVVVATSNVHPRELYKNGLNRQLFVPFIELIEERMDIVELAGGQATSGWRSWPASRSTSRRPMPQPRPAWTGCGPSCRATSRGRRSTLEVKGRKLKVPLAAMGLARFTFAELCEEPLGTVDYLALAHKFHTVFIDGIPVLEPARRDVARRFVNLIDTLYDARVGLIASAAAEPDGLYPKGDVHFLFERTVSRLIEMRSEAYLAARSARLDRIPPPADRSNGGEAELAGSPAPGPGGA